MRLQCVHVQLDVQYAGCCSVLPHAACRICAGLRGLIRPVTVCHQWAPIHALQAAEQSDTLRVHLFLTGGAGQQHKHAALQGVDVHSGRINGAILPQVIHLFDSRQYGRMSYHLEGFTAA